MKTHSVILINPSIECGRSKILVLGYLIWLEKGSACKRVLVFSRKIKYSLCETNTSGPETFTTSSSNFLITSIDDSNEVNYKSCIYPNIMFYFYALRIKQLVLLPFDRS